MPIHICTVHHNINIFIHIIIVLPITPCLYTPFVAPERIVYMAFSKFTKPYIKNNAIIRSWNQLNFEYNLSEY